MLRLTRMKIHQYHRVRPELELEFSDRYNLILGLNGTGKTTLLELIGMCLRHDFRALAMEPFHFEYELEAPEYVLQVRVKNRFAEYKLEVPENVSQVRAKNWVGGRPRGETVRKDPEPEVAWMFNLAWKPPRFWFPHLEVEAAEGRMTVTTIETGFDPAHDSYPPSNIQFPEERKPFRGHLRPADQEAGAAGYETSEKGRQKFEYLEAPPGANARFLVARVIGELWEYRFTHASEDVRVPPLVPNLVESPNPEPGLRFDESLEWWGQFLDTAGATATASEGGHGWSVRGGWSMFFASGAFPSNGIGRAWVTAPARPEGSVIDRACTILELDAIELSLKLVSTDERPNPFTGEKQTYYDYSEPLFRFTRRDGVSFPFHNLSYGQRRLFAFLCYLETWPEGPVLADELANGMHYAMTDQCLDLVEGRQTFLAMQNPWLVDHVGFESEEEVRASFVLCHTERYQDRDVMVWEHMSEEEAQTFFGDYQVGIQHVNEILRTRGLW